MRRLLRIILLKPVTWLANKVSSSPKEEEVYRALTRLLAEIRSESDKKGLVIPFEKERWIILSDQHKGAKNGADDFMGCEANYLAALEYYNREDYQFISLGDNEELWENLLSQVVKNNQASIEAEKKFIERAAFYKIFGNHDLFWKNDPFAPWQLKRMYGRELKVYEGIILQTRLENKTLSFYCTHGHQGDGKSDNNPVSAWIVSRIWAPLQAYLGINPNVPAYNDRLKTIHNQMMYAWSAMQKDLILITGHTHQPVFESLTHPERLYKELAAARNNDDEKKIAEIETAISFLKLKNQTVKADYQHLKPTYFNSGCCCFNDGDITGIEIENGMIRLIKWTSKKGTSGRVVLEERKLSELS